LSCIAQHIEHISLGHAQPMQYWSQVPSPVVLMPVVIVVVMVELASLAPEVELEPSAVSLLDASSLDDALLDSPPPLLDGSLLAASPSLLALLPLEVIVVPTVIDVPNVGSSRRSVAHASNESAPAMPSRADVSTISAASQTSSALDLEIPRVEERSQ
jgi:hypothetical protein